MKTYSEIFTEAADNLEGQEWYCGKSVIDEDDVESTCVGLAIMHASENYRSDILAKFADITGIEYPDRQQVHNFIYDWNDGVCQSKEEAVAALRHAAEICRKEEENGV